MGNSEKALLSGCCREKREDWIRIGSDPLRDVSVPLWVVQGASPKPLFTVVAGVHGCEYAGMIALARLYAALNPAKLEGTVALVPVANPAGFSRKARYVNPVDDMNLNWAFPGDRTGSITQRIAYQIFENIILQADYFIDLHGGDLFEQQLPHTKYYVTGDDSLDRKSRQLATVFTDCFYNPVSAEKRASLGAQSVQARGSAFIEASLRGIPSALSEAGSEGRVNREDFERDVSFHLEGLWRVLSEVGMYQGHPSTVADVYQEVVDETILLSEHGGFFVPWIAIGARMARGETIGQIRDLRDAVIDQISAPFDDGILRMLFTSGAVSSGDQLMTIWRTEERCRVDDEAAAK